MPATAAGLTEKESIELELARLRLRYTDEHPDVRELVARLRSLEDQPPSLKPRGDQEAITTTQIKRAQAEVANLEARRESLRKDITTQQAHVEQMPRSEQNLATLTRDFTQLRDNYDGLLRRRMDAQMAVRLQQRWTEDFEILDPARLPERHSFPNQPLFILGGIILGIGAGLGAALLAEIFSGVVLSLEDLEATVQVPVLAVLPVIDSRDAAAASRHRAVATDRAARQSFLTPGGDHGRPAAGPRERSTQTLSMRPTAHHIPAVSSFGYQDRPEMLPTSCARTRLKATPPATMKSGWRESVKRISESDEDERVEDNQRCHAEPAVVEQPLQVGAVRMREAARHSRS